MANWKAKIELDIKDLQKVRDTLLYSGRAAAN